MDANDQDDQEVLHDCILQAVSGKLHLFDCYGYARWDFVSGPKIECLWRSYDEDRASTLEDIRPLIYMLLCPEVARSLHLLQQELDDIACDMEETKALWCNLRQKAKRKFLQNQAYQKTASCIVFPSLDVVSRRPAVGCFFCLSSVETTSFCIDVHGLVCDQLTNTAEAFLSVHLTCTNFVPTRRSDPFRSVAAAFGGRSHIARSTSQTLVGKNNVKYLHIDNLVRSMHLVTSALYQQSFLQPIMGEIFSKHCNILQNTFSSTFLATAVSAFLLNGCRAVVVGKHSSSTQLLLHVMLLFSTKSSTGARSFMVPFGNVFSCNKMRSLIGTVEHGNGDWHECGANNISLQSFESPFHLARVDRTDVAVLIINADYGRIICLPPDDSFADNIDEKTPRARYLSLNDEISGSSSRKNLDASNTFGIGRVPNGKIHSGIRQYVAESNKVSEKYDSCDSTRPPSSNNNTDYFANGDFRHHFHANTNVSSTTKNVGRRGIITILDLHGKFDHSESSDSVVTQGGSRDLKTKKPYSLRLFELCDKFRQLSAEEMETDLLNGLVMPFKFFIDDLAAQLEESCDQAAKHGARMPTVSRRVSSGPGNIANNPVRINSNQLPGVSAVRNRADLLATANDVHQLNDSAESFERVALCELLGKLDKCDVYDVAFALALADTRKPGVVKAFRPLIPHIVQKLF